MLELFLYLPLPLKRMNNVRPSRWRSQTWDLSRPRKVSPLRAPCHRHLCICCVPPSKQMYYWRERTSGICIHHFHMYLTQKKRKPGMNSNICNLGCYSIFTHNRILSVWYEVPTNKHFNQFQHINNNWKNHVQRWPHHTIQLWNCFVPSSNTLNPTRPPSLRPASSPPTLSYFQLHFCFPNQQVISLH